MPTLNIHAGLVDAVRRNASDYHVVVGIPPTLRISGELIFTAEKPVSQEESKSGIYSLLSADQKQTLEKHWELNFALALPEVGRFRVNVYVSKGNVEAAFRVISVAPKSMDALGLPKTLEKICARPSGLILITGATGQGKTTTMASMIDFINRGPKKCRIVTIEDPIEYLHNNVNSVIIQREVGFDTKSFSAALVQSLRQDPNIICIGEMRDLETISTALTAAETGHLVLATLHTPDAPQGIDRMVDVFPAHQQQQIRVQIASCLEAVIAQKLLLRRDGNGLVVGVEVLIGTHAVRNLIREKRTEQLYGVMQTGVTHGMILMDDTLMELYKKKVITYETALSKARDPKDFKKVNE